MAVKVTEAGRTISLIVARQTINGREFPIRKSQVASVGDVFPDEQVSGTVLQYAKDGERGLEHVSDSELNTQNDQQDPEPVSGYNDLNSADAEAAYNDADDATKAQILEYELAHKSRAWAEKIRDDEDGGS